MPRFVHPDLLDAYRRANPYTEFRVEVSAPDAVNVIRRADQFTTNPPLVPPMIPANSLTSDARGSLVLAPTTAALASFTGEQSSYDLNAEDITRRLKGVSWTMDPAFSRAVARSVTARVQRVALAGFFFPIDFECQIYRVTKTPGVKEKYAAGTNNYTATAFTDYSFTPLLSPAPVIKGKTIVWDGANKSTLNFDLSNFALVLENTPTRAAAPDQTGELPKYYIVVRAVNAPTVTGLHRWLTDTVTARTIAGVGTFAKSFWARNNDQEQWAETVFAECPTFALNIDTYPVTGQAWYAIDVGKAPAANAVGRVVFDRFLPPGTTADLQLSSTSAGSGFAFVKHGDVVAVSQQLYWLSVRLFSDGNHRASPTVAALGIEWRIPIDVSVEGVPALPTREVSLPWPKPSIAEGSLAIVRTGVRDYLDTASIIGSTQSPAQLECDIYLASRHPAITRDKWLLLERMSVTNRTPSPTDEVLTLLSFASKLKPKIPRKVESISTVHTVQAGTTTAAVIVSPVLVGTSVSGNEYDGKGYYLRVRSSSSANIRAGDVYTIQGNTSTTQLDFTPVMPAALVAGDVIEVHSGIFTTQAISWNDADLADVWYQLLTTYLGIAPEKIGLGYLPRGGKPPRVTDIAPGDVTTQGKLKVTMKVSQLEPTEDLLAQVSAILGGITTEIQGQIVYIQLYPLRAPDGTVTVPLPPVARVFDRRDYGNSLQTPPGLEARATVMSASYGVPLTAAAPDTFQKQTTVSVDNDALLWHTKQDLEDFGSAEVPDKIARWFYNTSDNGLYAASALATTMVRALSTGLRVFPFDVAEINPDLMVGDSVVLVTDQYTDYEPSSRTPLRGMLAVRGVLVRVGNLGRALSMFVPGLLDNVTAVQGGGAGSLPGTGGPVDPPILSASFLPTGELIVNSQGSSSTTSQKIAVGTAEPTDPFVRAGAFIPGQSQTNLASGFFVAVGATAYVKAFAYDAYGNESVKAVVSYTRQGSGAPGIPTAYIDLVAQSATSETVQFNGALGAAGVAPIQWQWRTINALSGAGAWSGWLPNSGASLLPKNQVITRAMKWQLIVEMQTKDATGALSNNARHPVDPRIPALDIGGGTYDGYFDDTTTTNAGFRVFNRGRDLASDVGETAGLGFILPAAAGATAMLDSSRRLVNIYRSAVTEPVVNMFKNLDAASQVTTTSSRAFVDPSAVGGGGTGKVTTVFRAGIDEPVGNLMKFGDALGAAVATSLLTGLVTVNANAGLPAAVNSGLLYIAAGYSSPISGRIFLGDGSGWRLAFAKRTGSTTTDMLYITDAGLLVASSQISAEGLFTVTRGTVQKGYFAVATAVDQIITGSIVDDICIRSVVAGSRILFSTDNGVSVGVAISATGSLGTKGQLRATGWWASGDTVGLGGEFGVSGGNVFLYAYNRTAAAYGILYIGASDINLSPRGGATYVDDGTNTKQPVLCVVVSSVAPTTETGPANNPTLWIQT